MMGRSWSIYPWISDGFNTSLILVNISLDKRWFQHLEGKPAAQFQKFYVGIGGRPELGIRFKSRLLLQFVADKKAFMFKPGRVKQM